MTLLRNRHFLLLWLVTITTTLALELFTVTILVSIFEQTASTLQAAGTMVARTLPAFLLGSVAGVLVDRFPRKNVLISMDVVRLLLIGVAIVLLGADGNVPVLSAYAIMAGLSAATVFHQPARLALIPSLVTHDELVQANSFILVTTQIVLAISYALGGLLIQFVSLAQISYGIVVLIAIAIIAAIGMRVPKRADETDDSAQDGFWASLTAGWTYLRQHPIARPLTIMEMMEHLPHGIWTGAIMLAFTIQALNGDTADWGYIVTFYFAGMIIGSLAALVLSDWLKRYPGRIIVANACLSGVLTFAFASSQTLLAAALLGLVFGPPFALRDVAQDALLQGTVDEGQLGRVYATRDMLRSVVFMFAGIFFAWLSDQISVRTIYYVGGGLYILTGIYALSNRPLRESKLGVETVT